jgi:hypothetical protein
MTGKRVSLQCRRFNTEAHEDRLTSSKVITTSLNRDIIRYNFVLKYVNMKQRNAAAKHPICSR